MKSVLFVINTLGGAGAEKALLELLKRFSGTECVIDLYVLCDQGELIENVPSYVNILNREYSRESVFSKKGKKELQKHVLKHLISNGSVFKNIPYLIQNVIRMAKNRKIKIDKLLWRCMSDGGICLDKTYDIAIAYLEGGATYFVHDHVKAKKKYTFLHVDYSCAGYNRLLDRDCYLDFDKIFTVSKEVADSFLKVYPECREKTFIFHNLIDRNEVIKKSKLPGGFDDGYHGTRILTIGRLTEQKAYDIAIDAMKFLKDSGKSIRWYVIGEGELRNQLQMKIDSLGMQNDFILLGAKENPYPYLKQCDLYVHATRFEGKSIAVQEAQILGCTILVSDCNGNREQVRDGIDGELCQLSADSISKNILGLLNDKDKCRYYGENAAHVVKDEQENVLQMFDL